MCMSKTINPNYELPSTILPHKYESININYDPNLDGSGVGTLSFQSKISDRHIFTAF